MTTPQAPPPMYLNPEARLPYCKGCGHSQVLRHLSTALERLALPVEQVVLVTDIGCLGLADAFFPELHTVHTAHGRSTAFATGLALGEGVGERVGLKPVVLIGDGGAMIGLLHLVHAAQLDVDVTVIVHNNFVFGMTGGQHSALTPTGLVTATTPDGNAVPPLDILGVLGAAHAGFTARHHATDKALTTTLAEAVAHPGFAVVEVMELCTAHAVRRNPLSGRTLKEYVEGRGLAVGRITHETGRADFVTRYRQVHEGTDGGVKAGEAPAPAAAEELLPATHGLTGELRLVVAGSAGESVQSAARILCGAALAAGLWATQKNDYPVTQRSGFSSSEVCLSPAPIAYTGIEVPDLVLVASQDGWNHLRATGMFGRCGADTRILLEAGLEDPPAAGRIWRLPLRSEAGGKRAALAGLAAWATRTGALSGTAWERALDALGEERRRLHESGVQTGHELGARETGAPW